MDESLFTLLQNEESAHDEDLPKTGVPLELERTLSSMFIKSPGYGTRSSTVLKMNDKTIHFKERVYGKLGIQKGKFSIEVK
jgi:uncharacterized protein with NRDE domain